MKILRPEQFFRLKQSETLAVMGCGYSINSIDEDDWNRIEQTFDTFGMNWFCNAGKNTTFYLIREQCVSPKKLEPGSMIEDLVRMVNALETTLIVKRKTGKADNYFHADNLNVFHREGIVIRDAPGHCSAEAFRDDMFSWGLHHGKCTMYDVLHFALYMRYERIIFYGVDLYDYRYFWLPYDQTREIVKRDGCTCNSRHLAADNTIEIIKQFAEMYPDIKMFVNNPQSLLAEFLPIWE